VTDKPRRRWYRRPLLAGTLMLAIIAGAIGGVLLWRHSRSHESTNDAYIDVVSEHVSPRIAGQVIRVLVNDNQDVKAGQPLVELDPADYQNQLAQAVAEHSRAEAQLSQTKAQQAIAEAQLEQARANVAAAEANASNTASDWRRYEQLRKEDADAVSQQQLDNTAAAAKNAAAQLEAARKAAGAAQAQVLQARSQMEAAQAGLQGAAAQVEQARRNVSYTKVQASLDGRVATKTVAVGNYVQPGAQLMALVPPQVYVTANFKETQLARVRPGQPVEIRVDAYPDLKLRGHIDSIQPAAGQAFSVLPAQNATGNWVKIVQRVPVKIVFEEIPNDPERRLGPGMSVEVRVLVR